MRCLLASGAVFAVVILISLLASFIVARARQTHDPLSIKEGGAVLGDFGCHFVDRFDPNSVSTTGDRDKYLRRPKNFLATDARTF
jgi:hypothetical protein